MIRTVTLALFACLAVPLAADEAVAGYLATYGFKGPAIQRSFHKLEISPYTIHVHVARPARPVGTVYYTHGYLDHTGGIASISEKLLENHWSLVMFDLPGHGLSSGPRGEIKSFREYARVLEAVCKAFPEKGKTALLAHSTGGSVILESLAGPSPVLADHTILIAPLVRTRNWFWIKVGLWISSPFRDTGKRNWRSEKRRGPERDMKNDPLQVGIIPLQWPRTMIKWSKSMHDRDIADRKILVLQGSDDHVLDADYNFKFLKGKLPRLDWRWIPGGTHNSFDSEPQNFPIVKAILEELNQN